MPQPSLNIAPLLRPLFQDVADYESGCRAKLHSQVTQSCHTHPRLYLVVIPTHPPHPRTHHLGMHKPMPYLHPCSLTQGPCTPTVRLPLDYCSLPIYVALPSLFPSLAPYPCNACMPPTPFSCHLVPKSTLQSSCNQSHLKCMPSMLLCMHDVEAR